MMTKKKHNGRSRALWAYGYELIPPVARDRMGGVVAILDAGRAEALARSDVWEGRLVNGDQITHILVVSGSPSQDDGINHRLETELRRLEARYLVSASVEILRDERRRPGGDGSAVPSS